MLFQTPLVPAILVRRYKRFLADAILDDGREVTAHCANPGAMTGLDQPGMRIWLEPNDDPKRKLRFGWRLLELPNGQMAGIDTSVPNKVVAQALSTQQIPELSGYANVRPEVKYGQSSRIDFLLTGPNRPDTYVEVKNVHLSRQAALAEFPDCRTERGTKHLHELSAMAEQGHRAMMLYLVQRTDCREFTLARDIDLEYAKAFDRARECGVETLCYDTTITISAIHLGRRLPIC